MQRTIVSSYAFAGQREPSKRKTKDGLMLQHGRKSQSALAWAAEARETPKLNPPKHFNERELGEWQALMARLGEGWFPSECYGMVVTFCSISAALAELNETLSRAPYRSPEWERLAKVRSPLVMQMVALSTKLRIAPSTRNDRDRSATAYRRQVEQTAGGPKPWDVDVDETQTN